MATSAARKPPQVPASPHLRVASVGDRRHIVELKSADFESVDEPPPKSSIHPLKPPPLPRRQASVSVAPPGTSENSNNTSETLVDVTSPDIWIDVEEMLAEPTERTSTLLPNPKTTRAFIVPGAIPVQHNRSIGFGRVLILTLMINAVVTVVVSAVTVKWMIPEDRATTTNPNSESIGTTVATTTFNSREITPATVTEPTVASKPANNRLPTLQGKIAAKSKPSTNTTKTPTSKLARPTHP
jgi:hypothetical protein